MKTKEEILYDNMSDVTLNHVKSMPHLEEWILDAMEEYTSQFKKQIDDLKFKLWELEQHSTDQHAELWSYVNLHDDIIKAFDSDNYHEAKRLILEHQASVGLNNLKKL